MPDRVYQGNDGRYTINRSDIPVGGSSGGGPGGNTGGWGGDRTDNPPENNGPTMYEARAQLIFELAEKLACEIKAQPDSNVNEYVGAIWIDDQQNLRTTGLETLHLPTQSLPDKFDWSKYGMPNFGAVVGMVHNHPDVIYRNKDPNTGEWIPEHNHAPTPSVGDLNNLKARLDYVRSIFDYTRDPGPYGYYPEDVHTYILHDGKLNAYMAIAQDFSRISPGNPDTSWALATQSRTLVC